MNDIVSVLSARQARLLQMRSSRELFAAAVSHYKETPADFINDWCITYDPRVSPPIMPFELFPRQREFIEWLNDRYTKKEDGIVEKSRDVGMTWLCCAYAVWMWVFVPGASIAFGSRKEDYVDLSGNPDSIFEKIRMILDNLPVEFLPPGFDMRKHAPNMKIINTDSGSNIKGEAGDNIGRGGRSSIYFLDEAAFIERPDMIEAALSMNSDVKISVSTPNGIGNPFYRKRHNGNFPVFTFRWSDDPRKDEVWYRKQKRLLDPVIFNREIEIDYNASVNNALIDGTLVREAMRNKVTDIFGKNDINHAPVVLGVDVARFGSDRTVICCRQGRVVHWFRTFTKLDIEQVIGQVMTAVKSVKVNAIFVDVVGIGAGVYDGLTRKHDCVYAVNGGSKANDSEKYYNMRAEMGAKIREWLEDAPVVLPSSGDIHADLCALQYDYDKEGRLVLEKKEDAKKRGVRSPDHFDALGLTFARNVSAEDFEEEEFYHDNTRDRLTGY